MKNTAEFLLQELQIEGKNIIKTLSRVDLNHRDWQPHEKSFKFFSLAKHIADLCNWPARIIKSDTLDFQTEDLSSPKIESVSDLTAYAQAQIAQTEDALKNWDSQDFETIWTLKSGDHVIMQMPKALAIRFICQNHIIHHRAQLTVYLRMLDLPVPALYGPSADEQ